MFYVEHFAWSTCDYYLSYNSIRSIHYTATIREITCNIIGFQPIKRMLSM